MFYYYCFGGNFTNLKFYDGLKMTREKLAMNLFIVFLTKLFSPSF